MAPARGGGVAGAAVGAMGNGYEGEESASCDVIARRVTQLVRRERSCVLWEVAEVRLIVE